KLRSAAVAGQSPKPGNPPPSTVAAVDAVTRRGESIADRRNTVDASLAIVPFGIATQIRTPDEAPVVTGASSCERLCVFRPVLRPGEDVADSNLPGDGVGKQRHLAGTAWNAKSALEREGHARVQHGDGHLDHHADRGEDDVLLWDVRQAGV